jgi:hypothetical protein
LDRREISNVGRFEALHASGEELELLLRRWSKARTISIGLSGGHTILDVIGNPVANICQFQQFLFDQSVVRLFGQLSIFSAFVSKIVIPVHARPPRY